MTWLIRIVTAALPLIDKYGPAARQAAQDLVDAIQAASAPRGAGAEPTAADARLDALAEKVERNIQAGDVTPAAGGGGEQG